MPKYLLNRLYVHSFQGCLAKRRTLSVRFDEQSVSVFYLNKSVNKCKTMSFKTSQRFIYGTYFQENVF